MLRSLLAVVAFLGFIPIAHAGTDLGLWTVTRYYTPVEGQERYYNGWARNVGTCRISNLYYAPYGGARAGSFTAEQCMQGDGDGFTTADGTDLHDVSPLTIAACPRRYLGRTIFVSMIGYVRCADVGGAVRGNHVDVWAGIGDEGYETIQTAPSGLLQVFLKDV